MKRGMKLRIEALEKVIGPEERKKVFHWILPGETNEQIRDRYGNDVDLILIRWFGDPIKCPGPIETNGEFINLPPLHPDLKKKLDSVYGSSSSPQTSRMPQEELKIKSEALDKEIRELTQELKGEGLTKEDIEALMEEEESEGMGAEINQLLGGSRKRKFRIDEG